MGRGEWPRSSCTQSTLTLNANSATRTFVPPVLVYKSGTDDSQVTRYPGAKHKSFPTRIQAQDHLGTRFASIAARLCLTRSQTIIAPTLVLHVRLLLLTKSSSSQTQTQKHPLPRSPERPGRRQSDLPWNQVTVRTLTWRSKSLDHHSQRKLPTQYRLSLRRFHCLPSNRKF